MIRFMLLLFVVGLVAAVASVFMMRNESVLVIEWLGYHVEVASYFAILLTVLLSILLAFFVQLLWVLKTSPGRLRHSSKRKRKERGLTAVTDGFTAIVAGNRKQASKLVREAKRCLGDVPLVVLLQAQISQLSGDREAARKHYMAMLEHKETELIAVKGLLAHACEENDLQKAEFLAEKALKINDDTGWALAALSDIYKRQCNWKAAEGVITKRQKKKMITAREAEYDLAVICLARAAEYQQAEYLEDALKAAECAYQILPKFAPSVLVYSQLLSLNGERRKALKLIEKTWKSSPNTQLAEQYVLLLAGEKPEKRLQRAERLLAHNAHMDGQLVVAQVAMDVKQYSKARNYLKMVLRQHEGQRVCELMAELERLENAEHSVISRWEERARQAVNMIGWSCRDCGHSNEKWSANCPHCQSFASLEWGKPKYHLLDSPAPLVVVNG